MPKPGTPPLFGPPRNHESSACLRAQAYPWHAYAAGYRLAAKSLLNSFGAGHQRKEFVAYPLMFVCRHYLELRIKDITTCAHELLSHPKTNFKSHNLDALWNEARALSEQASPGEDPSFYEPIEACIRQFNHEDPGSYSFRYPVDIAGDPSLPTLDDFDIEHFASIFSSSADNLDAIADYFHEATQEERQALADAR